MKFQLKAAVILALFAGFAFAASNAFAQAMGKTKEGVTMKITGGADASFGTFSIKRTITGDGEIKSEKSFGTYGGAIQSNIILSGEDGAIDYYVRLRARGESKSSALERSETGTFGDNQLQTVRVRMRWTPSPIFNLSIGKLPGFGGTSFADRQPGRAYVIIGGRSAVAFFDAPTIHFQVTPGPVAVGVVIANKAQAFGKAEANSQTSTGVYAQAKFAGVKLGFRQVKYAGTGSDETESSVFDAKNETGSDVAAGEDLKLKNGRTVQALVDISDDAEGPVFQGKSSGDFKHKEEASTTVLEVAYEGGPIYVGLEKTDGDEVVATAGKGFDAAKDKPKAAEYSALGIAVEVKFGAGKAYVIYGAETKGELKKAKTEVNGLAIGYQHSLGSKSSIGVEKADIESTKTGNKGIAEKPVTTSAIRFFIASGF